MWQGHYGRFHCTIDIIGMAVSLHKPQESILKTSIFFLLCVFRITPYLFLWGNSYGHTVAVISDSNRLKLHSSHRYHESGARDTIKFKSNPDWYQPAIASGLASLSMADSTIVHAPIKARMELRTTSFGSSWTGNYSAPSEPPNNSYYYLNMSCRCHVRLCKGRALNL